MIQHTGAALARYWYVWAVIAALAAVGFIWLSVSTGAGKFLALAIAQALLALFCVGLRVIPLPH
jgi:hypothetical protein